MSDFRQRFVELATALEKCTSQMQVNHLESEAAKLAVESKVLPPFGVDIKLPKDGAGQARVYEQFWIVILSRFSDSVNPLGPTVVVSDGDGVTVSTSHPEAWQARQISSASLCRKMAAEVGENRPRWDKDTGELKYKGRVVRSFRKMSAKCIRVLDAFEESAWPARIDSPYPPSEDLGVRVRDLNDNLTLLCFTRDGSGEGIRWSESR